MSDSILSKLLAGPNAVTQHEMRDGEIFYSRSGSRTQRNMIEKQMNNTDMIMDAVATTLWLRLSDSNGERLFEGDKKAFNKYKESLDYDVAAEMAVLIRKDAPDEDIDETFDETVEDHLKNSTAQKEASVT